MVRKLSMQGCIDVAAPEIVFNILFGDDEFLKRYHKKVNRDPDAEASSWDTNNERVVKYTAIAEVPKMVTTFVGESFPMKEAQKYVKLDNSYTVTCEPVITSPGGERFFTLVETVLSRSECGVCMVASKVTVAFKSGIWGVEGAIESFMEEKARSTFEEWLEIARAFCQEKLARVGDLELDNENHECFFDAEESVTDNGMPVDAQMVGGGQVKPMNRVLSRFRAAFTGSTMQDNVPSAGLDAIFTQRVLRELNSIHLSCNALKGHVEKLDAGMLKIEGELGLCKLAMQRQQAMVSKRRQLAIFGLGLTAGLALGAAYARFKRRA